MGNRFTTKIIGVIFTIFSLLLLSIPASPQEILYDGTFTLQPNGDLDIVLKLTLPMEQYQRLRDSVSNLYLFMRDLASSRANVEVAQRKADWDDQNRTLTFTIHMLGAARNNGTNWSYEIGKSAIFSNMDEAKKCAYFNESGMTEEGPIRGTSRLQLPAKATNCKYDASKHMVTYVLPAPEGGPAGKSILLLLGGVLMVLGLGALIFSLVKKGA